MSSLTNTAVKNAKPKAKSYKLADGRGLFLEVTPQGGKRWRFRYRFDGKEKMLSLGIYPDVSLKEARERHHEARRSVANQIDPSHIRKQKKIETKSLKILPMLKVHMISKVSANGHGLL